MTIRKDSPDFVMGAPRVETIKIPFSSPSVPLSSELPRLFAKWVSAYYPHDTLHTSLFATISFTELLSRLAQDPSSSPSQRATVDRMSPEALKAVIDVEETDRWHTPFSGRLDHEAFADNLRAALVDNVLHNTRFELVWCQMSTASTAYAAWFLAKMIKELNNAREIRMWTFEGANHFVSFGSMFVHHFWPDTFPFYFNQSLIGICRRRLLNFL